MPYIRPVSDLRNNFAEISQVVHETGEPVFLTKNGHGNMVVMSIETYEKYEKEREIYLKLREAELQAADINERVSHTDVMKQLRMTVAEKTSNYDI